MNLSSWFGEASITEADIRAEIWRLGGRHMGQPLEGALQELKGHDLPLRQKMVLRACVRKLQTQ